MATNETDPLNELIVRTEDLEGENRRVLAQLLKPHVQIDPEKGMIHFINQPTNLNSKEQILVILLAKLALSQLNIEMASLTTPKDLEDISGLPGGTIRPKLKELKSKKIVSKGSTGYYIEAKNFNKVRAILEHALSEKQ